MSEARKFARGFFGFLTGVFLVAGFLAYVFGILFFLVKPFGSEDWSNWWALVGVGMVLLLFAVLAGVKAMEE